MSRQEGFRDVMHSIAKEITSRELQDLKFLCKEVVTRSDLSGTTTAVELFDILIERRVVSSQDTGFLVHILKKVGLHKLSDIARHWCPISQDEVNNNITRKIGLPNKHVPFIGRDDIINKVVNLLTEKEWSLVAILGPPGQGKSTVVTHIGHALYEQNVSVIFVTLREITTMDHVCRTILKTIDSQCSLSGNIVEQAENLLLGFKTPLVLILDNCEDIQQSGDSSEFSVFIEYIASRSSNVCLVLGSRKPFSTISFESILIHLCQLKDVDCASLLTQLAPGKFKEKEAETLGASCYGNPLIVKLAASRVRNGYKPLKLAAHLKSCDAFKGKCSILIQKHLINSIRVFLDSLERDVLLSFVKLSNFSGLFTEDDVSELYKGDWSNILSCLFENAFVDLEGEQYSIHPLLQTFCRDQEEQVRMKFTEEGKNAREAFTRHYLDKLKRIHREFVSPNFQSSLKQFEHDRMNINQALDNALESSSADMLGTCIDAFNTSINLLGKIMLPRQCQEIYNRLYEKATEMKDTKHSAESLVSLGFSHLSASNHEIFSDIEIGHFETASKLFNKLKARKRKTEAFAHCQSKLGLCYIANGKREEGKRLMQNAVTLRRELGDQVLLAASHCDRAVAAIFLHEYSKAITILKECYPTYKDNLGDHPWVATLLNYISYSYRKMDKLEEAIEYNQMSLAIRKKTLGDHQDTAKSYVHLAEILYEQRNLHQALEYYEKAFSIQEKVLGVHKQTEASSQEIAKISNELDLKEKREMKTRADSFRDDLNERACFQTQLSEEHRKRANRLLQEPFKYKAIAIAVIVIIIAIVTSIYKVKKYF